MNAVDPERWKRIGELFNAVVERPPQERAAFLAGIDPELRREVESLAQSQDGVLERPLMPARISILNLKSGKRTGLLNHRASRLYQPQLSPDDRWITFNTSHA